MTAPALPVRTHGRLFLVKLSLVVPAFNEEGALPELLARVQDVLESLPADWEVVVVDDLSLIHI